jgi:uncharacterized protein YaiL (DUF2058 family)
MQVPRFLVTSKDDDGVAYNFSDKNAVKKIHVNQATLKNISNGKLAIVKYDASYELVPAQVAEKIKQRDASIKSGQGYTRCLTQASLKQLFISVILL